MIETLQPGKDVDDRLALLLFAVGTSLRVSVHALLRLAARDGALGETLGDGVGFEEADDTPPAVGVLGLGHFALEQVVCQPGRRAVALTACILHLRSMSSIPISSSLRLV